MTHNFNIQQEIEQEASECEGIEQYDSILQKLRQNIRNHTQSFVEVSKGLDDSFIHNYNSNGRDHGKTIMLNNFKNEDKIYRGSLIIHNDEEEGDSDEDVDVTQIFNSPL